MKHLYYGIVHLILISVVLSSCKKDSLFPLGEEIVSPSNKRETAQVKAITYDDLLKKITMSKMGSLTKSLSQPLHEANPIRVNDFDPANDLQLDTNGVKMIEMNDTTTFTIPLKGKTQRATIFQNLVIAQTPYKTTAFIITYVPNLK